ncbi:hypothetical protein [Caloranaerobacter sp. DY30410]|uniref:hypothetical protein n=1 Tax=Caloranaerobacter sp. DY30410 TaxID=3238305 RepID=UPI003CFF28B6
MINELETVLNLLQKLNKACNTKCLSLERFNEQKDNIEDFKKLWQEYYKVLEKTKKVDYKDIEEIKENYLEIHRILNTIKWHLEEMDELLIDVLRCYTGIISEIKK